MGDRRHLAIVGNRLRAGGWGSDGWVLVIEGSGRLHQLSGVSGQHPGLTRVSALDVLP